MTKLLIIITALALSSCAFQGPSFRIGKPDNSEQLQAVTAQLQQLTQKHNALVAELSKVEEEK